MAKKFVVLFLFAAAPMIAWNPRGFELSEDTVESFNLLPLNSSDRHCNHCGRDNSSSSHRHRHHRHHRHRRNRR